MAGIDLVNPVPLSLAWDSGQRHDARPWFRLGVLGLVLAIDLLVLACGPFIVANSDEPAAVWIVFGILAALTLKLLMEGLLGQSFHLERVSLDPAGLLLSGARLTLPGIAFRSLDVRVAWVDVGSVEVVDVGWENRSSTVVDIRLGVWCPFGTEIRLVFLSRNRAQAFADQALMLRAGNVQSQWPVSDRPAQG